MKTLLLIVLILTLLSCGAPQSENKGVEKTYRLKVVFSDNHETEITISSTCQPKLYTNNCSVEKYSLYINCDYGHKIATDVKYFSVISEK